ncbi:MAG: hypothetical protein IJJ26_13915 [Victivallales bacterium]|nr:hypothetical protein [Victivallales bacterium]
MERAVVVAECALGGGLVAGECALGGGFWPQWSAACKTDGNARAARPYKW